jgi:hypothetical protein
MMNDGPSSSKKNTRLSVHRRNVDPPSEKNPFNFVPSLFPMAAQKLVAPKSPKPDFSLLKAVAQSLMPRWLESKKIQGSTSVLPIPKIQIFVKYRSSLSCC